MKSILFNTESVQSIQKIGKVKTIRYIHDAYREFDFTGIVENPKRIFIKSSGEGDKSKKVVKEYNGIYASFQAPFSNPLYKLPCLKGDVLYVKETWATKECGGYVYKAELTEQVVSKWNSSSIMPREAARIFLRVTDVQVERLHDAVKSILNYGDSAQKGCQKLKMFSMKWDSKINPEYRVDYGWNANPWVWVVGFEKIGREEALNENYE